MKKKATPVEEHRVVPVPHDNAFVVTSADSGKTYTVRPVQGGLALCTCKAGERGILCKHVRACYEWAGRMKAAEVKG